ncbi:ABC-ATPase domain-containing protein [Bacillus smithii]|uniref:ABC-ATPase domain-containing protein n=1 Tax=Bacillus smithii TaxID=1479 RepID=UPI003D1BCF1C
MEHMKQILRQIDGKGYSSYQRLRGEYRFPDYTLIVDHVQKDPFATPTKIRLIVPLQKLNLKKDHYSQKRRKIYCEDLLARRIAHSLKKRRQTGMGSGKSGQIRIDVPGQEILERTAVQIHQTLSICLTVGLPARGRTILGREAETIFFQDLPEIVKEAVYSASKADFDQVVRLCDQQFAIRKWMKEHDYIAFIANGSILPRESGISDLPVSKEKAIPFKSPKELEVSISLPHRTEPIVGMGIKKGVTLIVGGGFHGKSTLLQAIEKGIYNHIEGDGREFVLTDETAVKIRSEDGRSVASVNIEPFIQNLPFEKDTLHFSTENASGSTSQAANIMESLEAGAKVLLMDEDTSATNFMIRDARMQALISKEHEPITPFVDKVRSLFTQHGVSTILVLGGSGDYLDVADVVIKMDHYLPFDVTKQAKEIAKRFSTQRIREGGETFGEFQSRIPLPQSLNCRKGKKEKAAAKGKYEILYGHESVSLQAVEQIVHPSQTAMIAEILHWIEKKGFLKKRMTVSELLLIVERKMNEEGLASFSNYPENPGELARPRALEIAAALNRMRSLTIHC